MASREVQNIGETVGRSPLSPAQLSYNAPVLPIQAKLTIHEKKSEAGRTDRETPVRPMAVDKTAENKTGLPDRLKEGIESLSGYDLSGVIVNYNSPKPAQLNALAYTQGQAIEVGPGQERHLPHEAWHVVQQMQGRVKGTTQTKGIMVNDEKSLEQEGIGASVGGVGGAIAAGLTVAAAGAATVTGVGAGVIGVIAGLGALGLLGSRIYKRIHHRAPSYIAKEILAYWEDPSQRKFAEYIIEEHLGLSINPLPNEAELQSKIEKKKGNIRLWAATKIVEASLLGTPLDRAYAEAFIGALGVDPNIKDNEILIKKVKANFK